MKETEQLKTLTESLGSLEESYEISPEEVLLDLADIVASDFIGSVSADELIQHSKISASDDGLIRVTVTPNSWGRNLAYLNNAHLNAEMDNNVGYQIEIIHSDNSFTLAPTGYRMESVTENVVEGGFSLEVEADIVDGGGDIVTIMQSGHAVVTMDEDAWRGLLNDWRMANFRRM